MALFADECGCWLAAFSWRKAKTGMAHRLIIVPGENEVLRALPEVLEHDIEVQLLETANDALWETRNNAPELILADVDLPGMSGLDLAEILPNFGLPTRIILCSRQPDSRSQQQAGSLEVFRYVDGPASPDVLKEAIQAAMQAVAAAPAPVEEPEPAPAPKAAEPPTPPAKPIEETPSAPARAPESAPARSSDTFSQRPRRTPEPAKPAPAVAPPAPTPARKTGSRRNALVLTADNLTPIRSRMGELLQEVGAQCIMLSNREGMVLTEVGTTAGLPTMVLLPLLSTSFSAAGQISQMLRERDSSSLYMQEGSHYDLYCFDMAQQFMLVLIFDKAASATKIGTAWVYTKRAIRDMLEYLA